jgi:glycosyltransferase involved in cell wall biosynthesis
LINRCADVFHGREVEVVLVNNGSTDNSAEVLQKLTASHSFIRVENVEVNTGYGNGILAGLRSSKTNLLGWTHADMQTDPADILEGLKFFDADNQNLFVKGKRYGRPLYGCCFHNWDEFF